MTTHMDRERLEELAVLNSPHIPKLVNDSGRRMRWVGIGWVDEGQALGDEECVVRNSIPPSPTDSSQSIIKPFR